MLQSLGHKPTIANGGKEALELVKKKRFDVILMDICMPKIDGIGKIYHDTGNTRPNILFILLLMYCLFYSFYGDVRDYEYRDNETHSTIRRTARHSNSSAHYRRHRQCDSSGNGQLP